MSGRGTYLAFSVAGLQLREAQGQREVELDEEER